MGYGITLRKTDGTEYYPRNIDWIGEASLTAIGPKEKENRHVC